MEGDFLIPGLVELHTDHLEAHYTPRPGVRWDMLAALPAYDAQVASAGITTVFDCLRIGFENDGQFVPGEMRTLADALSRAQAEGRLRAEHMLHLRCEVSTETVMAEFAEFDDHDNVRIASLMDHAPGQRQFQKLDQYILYYKTKRGLSDEEFDRYVNERKAQSTKYSDKHRTAITEICEARGITIASHDDATTAHVDEAIAFGVRLAEFPTSMEAARASHDAGMSVMMGAPNVVRGGSHSGNVSARDLAEIGVLDVLSSDYVPISLIHAPFVLAHELDAISLPEAIAMVTATPARTVGLDDRGRIHPGLRADLVRIRHEHDPPVVRSVWREGKRVA
jgi:alpha-D-ribose 1-methylphosphonate 5-triphosphate diphosphatase